MNNYYIENRQNEENARIQKEEKIKKNKELIKQLFENILTPKIFSKDIILNNCENCSICLDAFECDKSSVCITPCNHIFHYDCLKKWVDDNVLAPKCPNCNNNLINNLIITSPINVDRKSNGNNSNTPAININENRNGLSLGMGKPEPLKYRKAWSRRITSEHRLVYNFDESKNLVIYSCRGHYED